VAVRLRGVGGCAMRERRVKSWSGIDSDETALVKAHCHKSEAEMRSGRNAWVVTNERKIA